MPNDEHEILVAHDLRKFYGNRLALRGLSFSLKAGRIMGFLGPNGAGKTTAIRILTTIMQPDSGQFFVDGISQEAPAEIRRRIGVLPESLGFPKQVTGIDLLTYFGQLYGRTSRDARAYGLTLLEDVDLKQRANSLIGSYSRGMRQRLGIARALINSPVVIFLDEPTLGLDPRGQQELLAMIRRIARERNTGVILCSHALSEIEDICDDVVILMSGQVIASGSVAEVIAQVQQNSVRIHVPAASASQCQRVLEQLPDVRVVEAERGGAGWLTVEFVDPGGDPSAMTRNPNLILQALLHAEIPVLSFDAEGGLQDVFLQLTEETVR
jgi:ABC-2 type transport system ATP-binding protein